MHLKALLTSFLITGSLALEIPSNIRTLQKQIQSRGDCSNKLASGFYNSEFEDGDISYCGDHLADYGIVYLQGPNGKLANMDVDCDGAQGGPQDDGRCSSGAADDTTIPETATRHLIEEYDVPGVSDLNTHEHSFVVFGNSNSKGKDDWSVFDPQEVGVEKLSVMAVVCGEKMFYGVWGDSNGSYGSRPSVGEASLSLATACFGSDMSGGDETDSSHNDPDVLFIAFTGEDAVPGADGADWAAKDFHAFQESLVKIGDEMVKRIGKGNGADYGTPDDDGAKCSWDGHCLGATCSVAQDCADDLTCTDGKCAEAQ